VPVPEVAQNPAPSSNIAPEVFDLLADAWKSARRDEQGYARLQEVGQIAGNRSSFDVRNYGFKRLSELLGTSERFRLEKREGGQMWVKRVR
jgi:OST-HTH/LOTUS domain